MAEHVFKKIELVGTSPNSISEAITNAVAKATQTERNLSWFEVTELRGRIGEGKVQEFQVTVKMGARID